MSETAPARFVEDGQSTHDTLALYCKQALEALLPDEKYRSVAAELLKKYPEEDYHQPAHGIDVMYATDWLLGQTNLGELQDEHTRRVLMMAAAAHDAGLYSEEAARYETNEHYATSLLLHEAGFVMNSDQLIKAIRAILGTIMDPRKQRRDTPEALLLHHADLGYVWSCNEAQFAQYALRFRREECGRLSWLEFQGLEATFLDDYMLALERDMRVLGLPDEAIQEMVIRVQRNRQYITQSGLKEPALENEWPSADQMIQ